MKTGYICDWRSKIVDKHECLECAETWTEPCGLGRPFIEVFWKGEERPEDTISPSLLASTCPREFYFMLTEDWAPTIRSYKARLLGTLWHRTPEQRAREGEVAEKRFGHPFQTEDGEIIVPFKPDLIIPDQDLLVDFKTTRTTPRKGPWPNAVLQVSAYLLMLNSSQLMENVGKKEFGGKFKPHPRFNLTEAQVRYLVWADIQSSFNDYRVYAEPMFPTSHSLHLEPGPGQVGVRLDALDIMLERLTLFLSVKRGEPPTYAECARLGKSPENDGWPTWKCKWCEFKSPCRKLTLNEERPKTDMYQDGIHEGQKGQIQALSLKEGAARFVEGLSEEARENLVRALAEKGE